MVYSKKIILTRFATASGEVRDPGPERLSRDLAGFLLCLAMSLGLLRHRLAARVSRWVLELPREREKRGVYFGSRIETVTSPGRRFNSRTEEEDP